MNEIPDNPFFRAPGETQIAERPAPETPLKPLNFREVTTSPLEEYSLRDGQTVDFPQWIEAYLLQEHNIGFATVTEKGIVIRNKRLVGPGKTGETRTYWSDRSTLIAEAPSRAKARQVVYVYNTACTDYIHCLDAETRRYLETIPAVDKPAVFDAEAVAKEAAKYKRALHRNIDRITQLHQDDTMSDLEIARKNVSETQRLIATLELPDDDQPGESDEPDHVRDRLTHSTAEIQRGQSRFRDIEQQRDAAYDRRQVTTEFTPVTPYDPYNK